MPERDLVRRDPSDREEETFLTEERRAAGKGFQIG